MTVGDIVNGSSNDNVNLTFIPAVGVGICLTSISNNGALVRMSDGAITGAIGTAFYTNASLISCKIMITNTRYLTFATSGNGTTYSGIQIT
tara:strand:+ start:248 stop:520 length:273 start_codon:yes stop_codon:yes gene_type:complete